MSIKEENLIQYEGALKAGQRLVKVGNTFMPVGVGGAFEPGSGEADTTEFENNMLAIIGDDASIPPVIVTGAKYYKCASVDTTAKTWTGYELVLTDGVYSVSETLTSGLSYTSITPVVGSIYSQDALIRIASYAQNIPTDGLLFYAPLAEASDTAETGQALTTVGDVSYTTVNSIPCMFISESSGYVSLPASELPSGADPRSVCCWAMWSNDGARFVGYGGDGEDERFCLGTGSANNLVILDAAYNNYCKSSVDPRTDTLTFFAVLYDGNELSLYIDGKPASKETAALNTTADSVLKIGYWNDSFKMSTGYIASVRCYDRVLSESEITALASEFTPTE